MFALIFAVNVFVAPLVDQLPPIFLGRQATALNRELLLDEGHTAAAPARRREVRFKRTFRPRHFTSANDPQRTSPIERHAQQRAMLDDVQRVLAELAVLAEIDGKRAISNHGM